MRFCENTALSVVVPADSRAWRPVLKIAMFAFEHLKVSDFDQTPHCPRRQLDDVSGTSGMFHVETQ
jgi:hypothetical protein